MKARHFLWSLVWLLVGGTVAFAQPLLGHRLRVVTSIPPVYCFVVNLVGNLATVDNLLPPGAEPHDFQFSPQQMKQVEAADLVVVNGLGLEAWVGRVMDSRSQSRSFDIIALAGGMTSDLISTAPYLYLETTNADTTKPGSPNPHIWLDPQLAEEGVATILVALQRIDPVNANAYASNAVAYVAKLDKLDAEMQAGLAPFKGQAIITFHDAFPYFARHYGLNLVGVVEKVPEVEPSPRYLVALRKVIEADHVKAIFTEPQSPAKLAAQIGIDYHVAVGQLDTMETGELKPDMYEQGMRANLATLQKYLQ